MAFVLACYLAISGWIEDQESRKSLEMETSPFSHRGINNVFSEVITKFIYL